MNALISKRKLGGEAARGFHEGISGAAQLIGSEAPAWDEQERAGVSGVAVNMQRRISRVREINRVRDELFQVRCGVPGGDGQVEEGALRWAGHSIKAVKRE